MDTCPALNPITIKFRVACPSIAGDDLTFTQRHLAEREARNAVKAGHPATVREVLVLG